MLYVQMLQNQVKDLRREISDGGSRMAAGLVRKVQRDERGFKLKHRFVQSPSCLGMMMYTKEQIHLLMMQTRRRAVSDGSALVYEVKLRARAKCEAAFQATESVLSQFG